MEIIINYAKDFTQYFPVLFFKDYKSKVLMFGFGNKNISFVYTKPDAKSNNGGQTSSESKEEKEYIFVWYKKMVRGDKTIYTQPFRTKVKGRNIKEAREQLEKFILGKMTLVIVQEDEYNKSDLQRIHNQFKNVNEMMKEMDEVVKKYNDTFEPFR